MDEEFPDQGVEGQDQDLGAERTRAGAPAAGRELRLAGGPTQGPPTGDDRVDAAVAGLSRLAGVPAEEHVAVLEEVHGRLRDILGEVNEGTP
jgi:hypothetical protein